MSERVMAADIDWTGLNEEKSIATINGYDLFWTGWDLLEVCSDAVQIVTEEEDTHWIPNERQEIGAL